MDLLRQCVLFFPHSLFLNRTVLARLLVGEGARSWAAERGISTLNDREQDRMITGTCV